MSIVELGVRRPVIAKLFTFTVIIVGVFFGLSIRREFFPEIRANEVIVTAPYPGASPDEVERSLAIKIEDRLDRLDDVKEINTTVAEGLATIRVEFESGVDIDDAVGRVSRAVDELQDLPEEAERIIVAEFEPNIPVISLTLFGDADEREMKRAIRQMRDDLRTLRGMGDVSVAGVRTDEIAVHLHEASLIHHGLSLPQVTQRIRDAMGEVPGGAVRSDTSNVGLRVVAIDEHAEDVRRIVVKALPDGRPLLLEEIADIRDGFIDIDLRTRFNGEPSVSLTAYALGNEDAIEMAELVKSYAAGRNGEAFEPTFRERLAIQFGGEKRTPERLRAFQLGAAHAEPPPGTLVYNNDLARFIRQRLELLTEDAVSGAMLAFIVLLIFLSPGVAWWVTAGLFVSVFGALILMRSLDISLNLLTMFGLIVVVGLLGDDAIVVAENIVAHKEAGATPREAAINGANEVKWPVFAAVLTAICGFLPLRLIEGRLGDMLGTLPIVVACAFLFSLIEAMFVLPSHMAHSLEAAERRKKSGRWRRLQKFDEARLRFVENGLVRSYMWVLRRCMRAPGLTVAIALAVLIVSLGMVAGKRLPFTFLTSADSESVNVQLRMPVGSPIEVTDAVVRRIEAAAQSQPEVQSVFSVVGATFDLEGAPGVAQPQVAQIFIELKPVEERDRRSEEVIASIQTELGPLDGVKSLRFEELQGGPSGSDLAFTVASADPESIMPVVEAIQARLAEYDGVFGLAHDADAGQRELRIDLRPSAAELGFTIDQVAAQVRAAVFGLEAHTFAGDQEDVDVRVFLHNDARRSLDAIANMRVFTPDGRPVALPEIAVITEAEGYATIRRLDRRRAVTISGDVISSLANPEEIARELAPYLAQLQRDNPGVRILPRGRQEDVAESLATLPIGMLAATGMIYVILTILFADFIKPFVGLATIPFALVGAIWGHLALGFDLTILSLIGFVALTGVVVNDALVFIEFYINRRAAGLSALDAAIITGRARVRPIFLNTFTTVFGLMPLILEQSFQGRFLIPMAITIAFGLMAGTFTTLLVLPSMLVSAQNGSSAIRRLWRRGAPSASEPSREHA